MKQPPLAILATLAGLFLAGCTTIPSRPLAAHEHRLVGIWMINQSVTGIGRISGVQQFLPDCSFNMLVNTVRGTSQASAQWEAINDQLHVTGLGKPDARQGYRFSEDGNKLYVLNDGGNEDTCQRYLHNPHHPLQQAYAQTPDHGRGRAGVSELADLMHGAISMDAAIHRQRAALGNAESIRWLEENEDRIQAMGSSLA